MWFPAKLEENLQPLNFVVKQDGQRRTADTSSLSLSPLFTIDIYLAVAEVHGAEFLLPDSALWARPSILDCKFAIVAQRLCFSAARHYSSGFVLQLRKIVKKWGLVVGLSTVIYSTCRILRHCHKFFTRENLKITIDGGISFYRIRSPPLRFIILNDAS